MISFLIAAILVEYVIVVYAMNLGVQESPENKLFGIISPLFHLIPIFVIIALLSCWTYLTKHTAVKQQEFGKGKIVVASRKTKQQSSKKSFLKFGSIANLWQRVHFTRATTKSAFTVLLAFATLIFVISLIAFPKLIYQTITATYQNNPALLDFVKGTSEALSPIGNIFSPINNALLSIAPGFEATALAFGSLIAPLAQLDNAGKYLFFQNLAVWISAFAVLFYGEFARKSIRYRKRRS